MLRSNWTTELDGSPVLNPFDPLVFLPPEIASHMSVVRYICVGTAGAFIWDILNNTIGNYQLLFQHRIRLPTVVCFISTITSLTYVIGMAIFQTTPVPNCATLKKILEVVYCVAVSSTSLLFFFRTRAVFNRDPWIIFLFACLCLAVFGACVTPIIGVFTGNIGPTSYCMTVEVKPYTAAAVVVPLINDTLIFIAITWRLHSNSSARRTINDGVRVLVFGNYLPAFSKAMLQDGQVYYLSTVTFSLITVTFLYFQSLPPVLRTLFTVPNMALMNIMACRVFRNMMLESRENVISTSVISREIRTTRDSVISLSLRGEGSGNDIRKKQNTALNATDFAAELVQVGTTEDKGHINVSSMV